MGYVKAYHRKNCNYNYNQLDQNFPLTLTQKIPLDFIKKSYRYCFRFMSGYRIGLTGRLLNYGVKKYKYHKMISRNAIQLLTFEFDKIISK